MRITLVLLAALFCRPAMAQTALAQSLQPGEFTYMSVQVRPGAGEAHPMIQSRDGTACDLLSMACLAKSEKEFGPDIYQTLRRAVNQIYAK